MIGQHYLLNKIARLIEAAFSLPRQLSFSLSSMPPACVRRMPDCDGGLELLCTTLLLMTPLSNDVSTIRRPTFPNSIASTVQLVVGLNAGSSFNVLHRSH